MNNAGKCPEPEVRAHIPGLTSEVVDANVLPIAAQTISSLMRTSGYGNMYRIYVGALRDGLDYHLAHIPDDFDIRPTEAFDGEYMKLLFAEGYRMARDGFPWEEAPPGVEVDARD